MIATVAIRHVKHNDHTDANNTDTHVLTEQLLLQAECSDNTLFTSIWPLIILLVTYYQMTTYKIRCTKSLQNDMTTGTIWSTQNHRVIDTKNTMTRDVHRGISLTMGIILKWCPLQKFQKDYFSIFHKTGLEHTVNARKQCLPCTTSTLPLHCQHNFTNR